MLEHSGSHSGDSGAEQGVVGRKDEIKLLGARLWEGKQGRRGKGRGMRARAGAAPVRVRPSAPRPRVVVGDLARRW